VRYAADDLVNPLTLSAGYPVAFLGMGDAIQHDPGITIQDGTTAGGLVVQADEVTFAHWLFSFSSDRVQDVPTIGCDHHCVSTTY
jgi:hypothetical protein